MSARGQPAWRAGANAAAELATWRRHFVVVYRDVQDLAIQRHLYREVMAIAAANPRVDGADGTVLGWIQKMHAHSAAVAVRKQVDRNAKTVSMRQLLEAIAPKAQLFTSADYLDRAPRSTRGAYAADEDAAWRHDLGLRFDELAGVGAAWLTAETVRQDIVKLEVVGQRVRKFVDQTIAHRDPSGPPIPTWDELNAAIDLLQIELVPKYNELLDAGHAPGLIPTWQYDWKAVFRVAWIPGASLRERDLAEADAAMSYALGMLDSKPAEPLQPELRQKLIDRLANALERRPTALGGAPLTPKIVRIGQILTEHPDMRPLMKSYDVAGFAECGVAINSWPEGADGPQVVGLFFVDRAEARKTASTKKIKQDFVVYWGGKTKPWYCGGLPRGMQESKTRKSIHGFCERFAKGKPGTPYGCHRKGTRWESTDHHYVDANDPALPVEIEIREAIAATLRACQAGPGQLSARRADQDIPARPGAARRGR